MSGQSILHCVSVSILFLFAWCYRNESLFGVEDTSYSWVVWNVDLQSVFPRQCVQSDYYTWVCWWLCVNQI